MGRPRAADRLGRARRHHPARGRRRSPTRGRAGSPTSEDKGDEDEAAVSPDGTEVAYTFYPRDDLNRSEIRVADLATGATRAVTGTPRMHDRQPAWSPDGRTIAYSSERSGFYELHLVGAQRRPATGSSPPRTPTTPSTSGTRTATGSSPCAAAATGSTSSRSTPRTGEATVARRGRRLRRAALDRLRASVLATYEDHATPPELRLATSGPRHAPAPRAVKRARHARAGGGQLPLVRRPRDPRAAAAAADTTVPCPRSSTPTAARPTPPATCGTATPSTSSPRATRGWRPTSAARPATAATSSAANHGVWGVDDTQGLPRRRRLPARAGLRRRRPPGDLRRQLRLLHGAAVGHRRPRAPLQVRGGQVRRLRHPHLVGAGRPLRRPGPRADDGPPLPGSRGLPRRLALPPARPACGSRC